MGISTQSHGIQSMLKEGYRHLAGLDEAVIKNTEACKELSTITRTSLSPNGLPLVVGFEIYRFCNIIMAKPAGGPRRDAAAAAGAGMDED
ncbi:unnamed protein product [Arabidopsis thaliana]|uniref:(thale cress) hypothetical protein n=1 Tax=Arabidopsis thaliana TaxID=3702 RepID=A0A7G2FAK2_ARATH|nr:unnamed protein product [Arabidopsis thaliana]